MISLRTFCCFVLLTLMLAKSSAAGLIVDQQPHIAGGPTADSAYVSFGDLRWQEPADDFVLSQAAFVNRIDWWGFYGSNFLEGVQPPIGDEMMRLRFFEARPGDALPGKMIFEDFYTNPERILTGRMIAINNGYPERRYRVNLSDPLALNAGAIYWLSISQIGALESTFRWEYSLTPPAHDFAFRAIFTTDWEYAGATSGLAFQLYDVPEPGSLVLMIALALIEFSVGSLRKRGKPFCRRHLHAVTERSQSLPSS
jgi:hypothetical protein